ncbi:hypothetical protein EDC64_12129 [Aquabacter spiritensis]|uniref:Uncharacterized protein n=1 Tax=Aquabacter spiritensis TaxID=933073 RepID=A0A4R3LM57_9HYPH|nr:hypothetical protein EDC64_12129 [Aquabacter spiritensis]
MFNAASRFGVHNRSSAVRYGPDHRFFIPPSHPARRVISGGILP